MWWAVLLILVAAAYHLSLFWRWEALQQFGRASLFVYWIHVELVYGVLSAPIHRRLAFPVAVAAFAVGDLNRTRTVAVPLLEVPLGYIPFHQIVDARNSEPVINVRAPMPALPPQPWINVGLNVEVRYGDSAELAELWGDEHEAAALWALGALLEGSPTLFLVESGAEGLTVEADPSMGVRAASLARLIQGLISYLIPK